MGKINYGRLILCGLVAGVVTDIVDYPFDGLWLANMWTSQLAVWGRRPFSGSQLAWLAVLGLIVGFFSVWIYVSIRPRFGPGVKTAIQAGFITWVLATAVPNVALMWVPHFFSGHLTLYTSVGGLVEIVVGTLCGAWLYKEA
jgi:hypothetical protein